jgi:ubiquinol-cytochrome c reductase cytochrome c1 subunit
MKALGMKATLLVALAALALSAAPAQASGVVEKPKSPGWTFEGFFGTFDRAALQRGLQVYQEVCAGCHGLEYIAFRNLTEIGLSQDQAKAFAAEFEVQDGPNDEGEMFDRPARLSDYFLDPYPNANAARSANNGALPPDLSLIVKARPGFHDYIYSLLSGYREAPEGVELAEGMAYNPYFPGHQIAMPEPIFDEGVEYADGTKATVAQQSHDVVHFLMWAAEPTLEARKRLGFKVMIFLIILTGLFYLTKRRVWADVH